MRCCTHILGATWFIFAICTYNSLCVNHYKYALHVTITCLFETRYWSLGGSLAVSCSKVWLGLMASCSWWIVRRGTSHKCIVAKNMCAAGCKEPSRVGKEAASYSRLLPCMTYICLYEMQHESACCALREGWHIYKHTNVVSDFGSCQVRYFLIQIFQIFKSLNEFTRMFPSIGRAFFLFDRICIFCMCPVHPKAALKQKVWRHFCTVFRRFL